MSTKWSMCMTKRNLLINVTIGALMSAGALAASTTSASAYLVCNRDGDCWHSDVRYRYPGTGYIYHPDDWYFHQTWSDSDRWHYRTPYHRERGYWRGGVWVTF